jgi:Protein of unknown function (DUF2490)
MNGLDRTSAKSPGAAFPARCFLLAILGLVLCAPDIRAQDQTEFWPEVDTYVNISPRTRFVLTTELNGYPQAGNLRGEFGPNFDVYLRPFLRPRLRDLDPAKSKLLTFRVGYRYFRSLIGNKPAEKRPITELTARFHIPAEILLSDRSRMDFRFISGKPFSWRYRNRVSLERNVPIRGYLFTPYVRDEIFYSDRQIAANAVMLGSIFPTSKRTQLELYYKSETNTSSTSAVKIRGLGVILSVYF